MSESTWWPRVQLFAAIVLAVCVLRWGKASHDAAEIIAAVLLGIWLCRSINSEASALLDHRRRSLIGVSLSGIGYTVFYVCLAHFELLIVPAALVTMISVKLCAWLRPLFVGDGSPTLGKKEM